MFELDLKSRKSIYDQIVDGIKEAIVAGDYKADEKLPSVRELSSTLTVNPNTIQKAYRNLEQQGWIYTASGLGCFVSGESHSVDSKKAAELLAAIEANVKELQFMGMDESAVKDAVIGIFDKGREQK